MRGQALDDIDASVFKPALSTRTGSVTASQTSVEGTSPAEKPYATRRNSLPAAVSENDGRTGETDASPSAEVIKVATVSRSASAVTPGTKEQRLKEAITDVKSLQPKR